jgi:HSP20 family protein
LLPLLLKIAKHLLAPKLPFQDSAVKGDSMRIPVQHDAAGEVSAATLSQEIDRVFEDVSKRAFELFQHRGSIPGNDRDDWFQAERELLWSPPIELIETETQYKLRLAAPGYTAGDIKVSALPDAIVVSAEAEKESQKKAGTVHTNEITSRKLFRRVELPSQIDVDKVTASFEGGLLLLTAAKSKTVKETAKPAATMAASS